MKIGVISLGCAKNRVDSEVMMGLLMHAGCEIVDNVEEADIIIVNTCGFIREAKQEAIDEILEAARDKREDGKLIVTGCLAQRYPRELLDGIPEIDAVLGIGEIGRVVSHVRRIAAGERYGCTDQRFEFCQNAPRVLSTPPHYAYLKVADGCDNRCAYCAIPGIRGSFVSRPIEELVAETAMLVERGVKEIILVAQDTTRYGEDLYGAPRLIDLLNELSDCGAERLRVMYYYPEKITEDLLDAMLQDGICRYIDLPVQHCSDGMLAAMNRRGGRTAIDRAYRMIRDRDFTLRTTVLLGFPGEREEHFEELLAFLRDHPFDRLGAFAYSREEDTAAYWMPDRIPGKIARARVQKVMRQQREISTSLLKKRIGEECTVLVDSAIDGQCIGRSAAEAPEIDGVITFFSNELKSGDIARVCITGSADYDLKGEVI